MESPKKAKKPDNKGSGFCTSNKCIFRSQKFISILRIIAKILSLLSILFLLGTIFGSIFSPEEGGEGFKTIELIASIFFPIGVLMGLILSWKKEKVGAIISIASMCIFYLLIIVPRSAWRMLPFTFVLILPSVLFLISSCFSRKSLS